MATGRENGIGAREASVYRTAQSSGARGRAVRAGENPPEHDDLPRGVESEQRSGVAQRCVVLPLHLRTQNPGDQGNQVADICVAETGGFWLWGL